MVKWEQSGIRSNVSPKFNDAAKIVARGSTPYKTINDLNTKLPAEFSGSVAITSTLNGLDACHSGAEALPGLMNDIANGMTIGDNKSYADLFSKFQAAQQGFAKAKFGADFFDTYKYSPTEQEIEKMIAAGVDPNMVGDGTAITTPYPERPAPLSNNVWDQFCTGAKTAGLGLASGFFGFFGDTIGGAGAMVLNACGKHELAYRWTKDWDWGGAIDAYASDHGVDTDSLLYTGAKVTGQLGANGLVLAIPGVGQAETLVCATMYSCQSYSQNYRGSIEDYLAQNNIQAPRSGRPTYQLNEAVKHITPEMYDKATINAGGHAVVTFSTTLLTGGILHAKTASSLGDKVLGNTLVHGAGSLAHQVFDVGLGRTDKFNMGDVALAAGLAGFTTYAAKPESATAASRDTAMRGSGTNVLNDLKDSPAAKSVGEFTSKVANSAPVNAVKGIMAAASKTHVGNITGKIVKQYINDATGGSHSFTLPLVHSIVGEVTKMVKNKK